VSRRILNLPLLLLMLTGCATATQGPLQRIHIDSDPQGATIRAKQCGVSIGAMETPATLLVSRRATRCEISLHRSNYEPVSVLLSRKWSERMEGNYSREMEINSADDLALAAFVAMGMAGGFLVDVVMGATYELDPSRVFVELVPEFLPEEEAGLEAEPSEEWWREREAEPDSVLSEEPIDPNSEDSNPPHESFTKTQRIPPDPDLDCH
jgi:hypothetical protein